MLTIFTLSMLVYHCKNDSSVAVSKIHHLKAAGILMLLSQNVSMWSDSSVTAVCYSERSLWTASLERGDFDWQVCVRIQFHSEWKFLARSDKWTFDLRPTLKFIIYVFMHPGSAPAVWAGAGGVDGSWFCCLRIHCQKKSAKMIPWVFHWGSCLNSRLLYFIYPWRVHLNHIHRQLRFWLDELCLNS